MVASRSAHPTSGGSGGFRPLLRRGDQHQPYPEMPLPKGVPSDPVAAFVALLEAGLAPQQIWPACSTGFGDLLASPRWEESIEHDEEPLTSWLQLVEPYTPAWGEGYPTKLRRMQEIIRRQWIANGTAPKSAIGVAHSLEGWIWSAQGAICTPDWFLDPTQAVVICADEIEVTKVEAMLSHDYEDPERNEDQLSSARWVAESLMAPSPEWRYSGAGPVVLASEILPGASWREVFLSPGCRGLTADQLLPAVVAAKIGVHVVAAAAGP